VALHITADEQDSHIHIACDIILYVKLVLDTSVIVAATRSDAVASRQLLVAALQGHFELLLSVALALEYEAVLKRPEQLAATRGTLQQIDKLLRAMIAVARPVHRQFFWRPLLQDAHDEMVLEVAISGKADLLVTFNRRDFETIGSAWGIAVVTPQEALRQMRRNDEEK
jgi:putative PIN family toxin of toxin-antitoxin system